MKFGFIAGKVQKSFDALAEKAAERGHTVEHVPLRDMPLSRNGLTDFAKECDESYDALHYYVGVADPIGIMFGNICNDLDIPLFNNRMGISHLTHDKMSQTLNLSYAGLPLPKTEFTRQPDWEVLKSKLGDPVIAKRVRGTHGTHVHKIQSQSDLDEKVDAPSQYLFQEYLPHRNDVRVLVLNGKAVCGYRRVPAKDDFRANLALGGYAEAITDDSEKEITFSLAEAAIAVLPHELAGVDLIKSDLDGKYRLIEINVNPSWYGLTSVVDTCFEDKLLDVYEMMANKNRVSVPVGV